MNNLHHYKTNVTWTGNRGDGTLEYKGYDRNHTISVSQKPDILASSDASFMGDAERYNPEELFLASLSSCHMLWYLHLCAEHGIVVTGYTDLATGSLDEHHVNGGKFTEVMLHPHVTVAQSSMIAKANEIHELAGEKCFIANSCNFPVKHHPVCKVEFKVNAGV